MRISNIICRKIFDSRSEPTVEIEIPGPGGIVASAKVPSGKSRGKNEAAILQFPRAVKTTAIIKHRIAGRRFHSIEDLDSFLTALDGTGNKSKLGGNVILGISMAFSRLMAASRKEELWRTLRAEFFTKMKDQPPLLFSNVINGGAHARNSLDIQEYMFVARNVERLIRLYGLLGEMLRKSRGITHIPIGDEGGYALDFSNNLEPLLILGSILGKTGRSGFAGLALDVAASNLYRNGAYIWQKKRISREKLAQTYVSYLKKARLLFSIEDPFAQGDYAGFKTLREIIDNRCWIVGDDLTCTDPAQIRRAAKGGLINGVVIKPNQIGTVTETARAIQAARDHGLRVVVSHRSGETEDNFIVHIAKACGADGLKIGAPARERMPKFNEVIRIYDSRV